MFLIQYLTLDANLHFVGLFTTGTVASFYALFLNWSTSIDMLLLLPAPVVNWSLSIEGNSPGSTGIPRTLWPFPFACMHAKHLVINHPQLQKQSVASVHRIFARTLEWPFNFLSIDTAKLPFVFIFTLSIFVPNETAFDFSLKSRNKLRYGYLLTVTYKKIRVLKAIKASFIWPHNSTNGMFFSWVPHPALCLKIYSCDFTLRKKFPAKSSCSSSSVQRS